MHVGAIRVKSITSLQKSDNGWIVTKLARNGWKKSFCVGFNRGDRLYSKVRARAAREFLNALMEDVTGNNAPPVQTPGSSVAQPALREPGETTFADAYSCKAETIRKTLDYSVSDSLSTLYIGFGTASLTEFAACTGLMARVESTIGHVINKAIGFSNEILPMKELTEGMLILMGGALAACLFAKGIYGLVRLKFLHTKISAAFPETGPGIGAKEAKQSPP
jgi:hypothetical protein